MRASLLKYASKTWISSVKRALDLANSLKSQTSIGLGERETLLVFWLVGLFTCPIALRQLLVPAEKVDVGDTFSELRALFSQLDKFFFNLFSDFVFERSSLYAPHLIQRELFFFDRILLTDCDCKGSVE